MKQTNKWNSVILDELTGHGIVVNIVGTGVLAINRTSAHNAKICRNLDEFQIIKKVMEIIKSSIYKPLTATETPSHYITWGVKTDDVWFLEIYDRS